MSDEKNLPVELEFTNDLEYSHSTVPTITDPNQVHDWVLRLQKFIKLCEAPPAKIKKYKVGKTEFDYVPIDTIETEAKRLFMGLMKEFDPNWQVVGNEIIGTQRFELFHPVAGVWISVVGWGAVRVRMNSDSDHTDPKNKIKNALQMDFPHLGAECFKNAMQRLGRRFGRGLRRDYNELYTELVKEQKPTMEDAENEKELNNILIEVKEFTDWKELQSKTKSFVQDAKGKNLSEVDIAILQGEIQNQIRKLKGNKNGN